jgi:hypothetical protein
MKELVPRMMSVFKIDNDIKLIEILSIQSQEKLVCIFFEEHPVIIAVRDDVVVSPVFADMLSLRTSQVWTLSASATLILNLERKGETKSKHFHFSHIVSHLTNYLSLSCLYLYC